MSAIGWNNRVLEDTDDTASIVTVSGTFSSLAFDAAFPGSNVLDPDESLYTKIDYVSSSGDCIVGLRADWGTNRPIRVLAVEHITAPEDDLIYIFKAYSSSGTLLAEKEFDRSFIPQIPGKEGYYNLHWILPSTISAARFQVDIVVFTGSSGSIKVGHMWASDALVLDEEWGSGWGWVPMDQSPVAGNGAGAWSTYRRPKWHGLQLSKRMWSYEQAMGNPLDLSAPSMAQILLEAGRSDPVLCVVGSTDHETGRFSRRGLIRQMPTLNIRPGKRWDDSGLIVW